MKNILVVENDRIFRHLFCDFLRNNYFHVIEAKNNFMGMHLAQEQYPDLIIYSLEMVEEIGYQNFQYMYKSFIDELPLIFLTNEQDTCYSEKKIRQIASGILLKKTVALNMILMEIQVQLEKNRCRKFLRSILNDIAE